jgi:hypothetical protein
VNSKFTTGLFALSTETKVGFRFSPVSGADRDLDLELRLARGDVVRRLDVGDARQLQQDLVVADGLDHRLGDAEAVDAPVDDAARPLVVLDDALAGRDLLGLHLEHELRSALEVQTEMGLDLLVDREVADAQADAGAVEREREPVLRDVDEDGTHEDQRDEPGEPAVHEEKFRGGSGVALGAETLFGLAHLAIEGHLAIDPRGIRRGLARLCRRGKARRRCRLTGGDVHRFVQDLVGVQELLAQVIGRAAQIPDDATDVPGHPWHSLRAEHDQRDDQDEEELSGADAEHQRFTVADPRAALAASRRPRAASAAARSKSPSCPA